MKKFPKPRPLEEVVAEVEAVRDSTGRPIDERIKPLVIGLRRWGLRTVMSCEGHYDSGFPFPWVEVDRRDVLLLMELVQRQNRPVVGGFENRNTWVLRPHLMESVRLQPENKPFSLSTLQGYAEEFGELLQKLEIGGDHVE